MLDFQPAVASLLPAVFNLILITFRVVLTGFRQQARLQTEIIALRHQLTVLQRTPYPKRLLLNRTDRCFWVWLSRFWSGWRSALIIVKPEAVIGWHRRGFQWYWTWKIRHGRPGRPKVPRETRELIRTMSRENVIWGVPRIRSELLKLGIRISEASVAKCMVRHHKPPSQTGKTFLQNHVSQLGSIDFFTVHTIWFEVLLVFGVLAHDRRRVLHFNEFREPVEVLNESRLHLSLDRDSPNSRPVQSLGKVIAIPEVGSLHHRYKRRGCVIRSGV